jgi:nitroimidazol reductase NimA-like FMN-containing flavoprotein (pyridoxamine 5'-phosphate oxidase superfamily)
MILDDGLELLTDEECRRLLAMCEVGRVGITIGALPAIFPVNYRVIDGAIVFRTSPGSKLSAAAAGAVVAFEVDDYEAADRSGWSVLAIGRAEIVFDLDLTLRVLATRLEPYVEGFRTSIVRIEPTLLSGRRLVHTPQAATALNGDARAGDANAELSTSVPEHAAGGPDARGSASTQA